jgi:hypothetical protein
MATQVVRQLQWVASDDGSTPEVFYDPGIVCAAAQTFIAGDLVTITPATGTIAEYAVNGDHLSGIALEDAVVGSAIKILKIRKSDTYKANICNGATATTATAITQLGIAYGLYTSAAGIWKVDTGNTTAHDVRVKVTGFVYGPALDSSGVPYQKAIGDAAGQVYCKFLSDDGTNLQILDFDI